MPVDRIVRAAAVPPNASNNGKSNTLRVDSATDTLNFGTGSSGTTEKQAVDTTSVQTVTGKNIILPTTVQAVDGAIAIASGTVVLTKGSAAAMTLAAPTAGQQGTEITIVAGSAFAHVVTATGLINNGTTGGPHNTWTAAAFIGSSITLIAYNLQWVVQAQVLGTVA